MKLKRLAAITVAGLVVSTAVAAAPDTPEQIAAAKAEADRLIAASGDPAAFINRTHTKIPYVVHRPSGVACFFWEETGGVLEIIAPTADHAGGFRCHWANDYPAIQEVVRPNKKRPVQRFRQARLDEYRTLHPDLRIDREIPGDPNGGISGAPMLSIMFTYGGEPATRYGCATVSLINGWEVTRLLDDSFARQGFKKETAEFMCTLFGMNLARTAERPAR